MFLAVNSEQTVVGYYTLASTSLSLSDLPITLQEEITRYPTVPAVLLGRLAVDKRVKGLGLGQAIR